MVSPGDALLPSSVHGLRPSEPSSKPQQAQPDLKPDPKPEDDDTIKKVREAHVTWDRKKREFQQDAQDFLNILFKKMCMTTPNFK